MLFAEQRRQRGHATAPAANLIIPKPADCAALCTAQSSSIVISQASQPGSTLRSSIQSPGTTHYVGTLTKALSFAASRSIHGQSLSLYTLRKATGLDIMDTQERGRSPSAGHQNHIRHSPSPSPHAPYNTTSTGLGLEQSLSNDPYSSNSFNQLTSSGQSFDVSSQYLTTSQPQQFPSQPTITEHTFLQAQGIQQRSASPQFGPQGNNLFSQDLIDISDSGGNNGDFDQYFAGNDTNQEQSIDPSFLGGGTLDPHLLDSRPQDQSVDPSNLMNQMATTQAHSPTPPHLLQPTMNHQNSSPRASPSLNQGAFPTPGHSRHVSLDPSAAYTQGQGAEWGGMGFHNHRKAPSDTYSDVSSSAQPSPYLGNNDSFDHNDNPSPLLSAQQDPAIFQDVMQFGQFTLSDNQSHVSPGHSPHISPRLMPQQQSLPPFTSSNNFGLSPGMNSPYGGQQGMEIFQGPALLVHNDGGKSY